MPLDDLSYWLVTLVLQVVHHRKLCLPIEKAIDPSYLREGVGDAELGDTHISLVHFNDIAQHQIRLNFFLIPMTRGPSY